MSIGTRVTILITVVGLAVGGFVVYGKATATKYSVLYANLDDKTASDVLAKLDAKGIAHQIDGNGTRILVPTAQLATARLDLAAEGVTGQAVPKGFDEIFANQGLASSDFEQRVNYERALEGELARTLLAMDPVSGANVQLSIPEQSIFIGDSNSTPGEKPTASVMLSLKRPLTADEVNTVANMIGSSVEGLTPQEVTIASSDGTLLQAAGDDTAAGSTGGASSTKNLEITRDYENTLSTRLTDLARTLTGQPGATVEVRAVMDFTQSTVEKEVIDPTKNTPTADHTTTETWTGTGATAGGTTGVDGGPTGSGSGNGTYNKSDQTTTYTPGDRTITKSTETSPTVTRLSIAVVVPVASASSATTGAATGAASTASSTATSTASTVAGATTASTIATTTVDDAMLKRVIGSAAGIDSTRGDTIEVALVPAMATDTGALITDATPDGTTPTPAKPLTTMYAEAAGAGAVAMLLIIGLLRRRKKKKARLQELINGGPIAGKSKKNKKKDKGEETMTPTITMPAVSYRPGDSANDPDKLAVDEIKGDLERMLNESPESLAALLSSWMAK
ncbi:MAG: fliF [Ilumatobacteraceae bacterium]|nr:fliF [Ilumatobacteraceae bacterium]